MFEKEAEEFVDSKKSFWRQGRTCIDSVRQAYQQGAEFGYNKANEWHFVKDGDLPKDTRYVWTNVGPSYYDDDRDCPCWRDEFGRTQGVIAWCEPKFEE